MVLPVPLAPPSISIHALRTEGDAHAHAVQQLGVAISIHALRTEGDANPPDVGYGHVKFLSTPSVRRATFALNPGSYYP